MSDKTPNRGMPSVRLLGRHVIKMAVMLAVILVFLQTPVMADGGMWLINRPPVKVLKTRYGFEPTASWLEHLQKSCVRFGGGGSASLVSANGLVMTNHHVGSGQLQKLSTAKRNLLETGFYAPSFDKELPCQDLEVRILWDIDDVTDRVNAAAAQGHNPAEANEARHQEIGRIEKEAQDATGMDCDVVTLYHGAWYHLYKYKRFTDVRLVMAPEQRVAFFGGDNDNFEYPRFDLDISFFRIYENGRPLAAKHFLKWSTAGAKDSDLVFVAGHPARTQRLYTFDHLKFLRDTAYPTILKKLWRREIQLQTFAGRSDEQARIANEQLHGVSNSRKALTGMLGGLLDPAIMRTKFDAEQALRDTVRANPTYNEKWGSAWHEVAGAEAVYRDMYERYTALQGRRSVLRSRLTGIARLLVGLTADLEKPSTERLPEFQDAALDSLYLRLYSPAPIYNSLEMDGLASGLSYLAETFGAEDPLVVKLLAGQSPRDRAATLITGTRLKSVEERRRYVESGRTAVIASNDPLIRFALELEPVTRALRKKYEDQVEGVERDAYAKIADAQFAVMGETIAPDATGTLRLAFGVIKGFKDRSGQKIPPFTTFAGLYERWTQRHGTTPFELPPRWIDGRSKLSLDTPLNFVSTTDVIGGNSGSPVVNRKGEVVGLIFDMNLPSLVWSTIYTDKSARSVAVDTRGIVEGLQKIYQASALVDEIVQGHR